MLFDAYTLYINININKQIVLASESAFTIREKGPLSLIYMSFHAAVRGDYIYFSYTLLQHRLHAKKTSSRLLLS